MGNVKRRSFAVFNAGDVETRYEEKDICLRKEDWDNVQTLTECVLVDSLLKQACNGSRGCASSQIVVGGSARLRRHGAGVQCIGAGYILL